MKINKEEFLGAISRYGVLMHRGYPVTSKDLPDEIETESRIAEVDKTELQKDS